jgi:MauM/NapG family ferredoxin protein
MAAARALIPRLAWGFLIMGLALFLGRFFCGYVCPMGATVDFADRIFLKKSRKRHADTFEDAGRYRDLKYLLLMFVAGTCVMGLSSVFLFSPLSLITRFYAFVFYPLILMLSNLFLDTFRPVFPLLGLEGLRFAHFDVPVFDTNLFVFCLVLLILYLGIVQPRFWCRNLCPAGAILAFFSRRPLLRRQVSSRCTRCGRCARECPMGAIGKDYETTAHFECITCLKCREICPEGAISFEAGRRVPGPEIHLGRRRFLGAGAAGTLTAAVTMTSLRHLHGGENPRALLSSRLIRPPGALPEPEFQARCVRCGQCMKGCLTNTLQPVWFEAGLSGLWSPKITARLAGCEQNCNACGHLCPTGAIRPLGMEEKVYAKVGTARIIQSRCIAWEQDRKCLICDEICPYNAISSRFAPGHPVTVPFIDENRCNGCGYCENKCPVMGESAVVVEPLGQLRLARGSYKQKAGELGLIFHAKSPMEDQILLDTGTMIEQISEETRPEEAREGASGLPPGFTVGE